jgi:hypothetical protein
MGEDNSLSSVLEQITAIDREIDDAELRVKELKKKREAMANVAVEEMTGGSVVRQATETGRKVVWQMNSTVAKQILRALRS